MSYTPDANYGRALLNSIAAQLPIAGRIFVVVNSSDAASQFYQALSDIIKTDTDGQVRLFTDLATAYAATQSGNNDVIALVGGPTSHKLTSMLTVSNNRVHFLGLDSGGRANNQRTIISSSGAGAAADVSMVKVTGTGCTFRNIKFSNGFTVSQNLSAMLDYGNNTYFENCTFHNLGSGHLTNASAGDLILAGGDSIYKNCEIGQDTLQRTVASGQTILISKGTSSQAATRVIFDHCWISNYSNKTTQVFVRVAADGDIDRYVHFKNCSFMNFVTSSDGAQMAVAVSTNAALVSGLLLLENPFTYGATKIAVSTNNANVYLMGPVGGANTSGISVQATT